MARQQCVQRKRSGDAGPSHVYNCACAVSRFPGSLRLRCFVPEHPPGTRDVEAIWNSSCDAWLAWRAQCRYVDWGALRARERSVPGSTTSSRTVSSWDCLVREYLTPDRWSCIGVVREIPLDARGCHGALLSEIHARLSNAPPSP